jgi:molybdenum cofactor cytidylyltransferase
MPGIGLIILAAGESRRMGEPKQLLPLGDKSLLRHAVETALRSTCWPVVVVLGAHAEEAENEIRDLPVWTVKNKDWRTGMSSSIRVGVEALDSGQLKGCESDASAVLIMLCDQPLVSPELLKQLVAKFITSKCAIVASEYNNMKGVPAVFDERHFEALKKLDEPGGAKALIKRAGEDVQSVAFAGGIFDVDTVKDYQQLRKMGMDLNETAVAAN